ncbi:hypothetical protein [Absidia glauca]|uniref:Uncharacterized protein n=1 Tax=Absidia glauca TaxID=4829 RepID=A0A163K4Z9_ABSGL|nr:hypothetical protein [Absidia glauca]
MQNETCYRAQKFKSTLSNSNSSNIILMPSPKLSLRIRDHLNPRSQSFHYASAFFPAIYEQPSDSQANGPTTFGWASIHPSLAFLIVNDIWLQCPCWVQLGPS